LEATLPVTTWTPDRIAWLRAQADAGRSGVEVAAELGITRSGLQARASQHDIRFRGTKTQTYAERHARTTALKDQPAVANEIATRAIAAAQDRAEQELRREIERAKAEAATAPLYRGGRP
jgi:hypothetical protein